MTMANNTGTLDSPHKISMTNKKYFIGAHTSAAGGVSNALLEGQEIGATTIQLFTSNQRQWKARPISEEQKLLWKETKQATGIEKVMSHGSYLINLGSPDEEIRRKSLEAFKLEIERCHALDIDFLNFHPGAATTKSKEACLDEIIKSLKQCKGLCENGSTKLLLETTAGQGSTVGSVFEELSYIIEGVEDIVPIGVCIDTCHIFAAGYDIRTQKAWDGTLYEFDQAIGLNHLYALHLNDSKHDLGSKRDRHACLGKGKIGIKAFEVCMTHPKLCMLPKYLETPEGKVIWEKEIAMLREFGHETNKN